MQIFASISLAKLDGMCKCPCNIVQLDRQSRKCFGQTVKKVLSTFLVLQLLFLLVLASSPALHHVFHADSDKPGHECLVTCFIKGQLSSVVAVPIVALFVSFVIYSVLVPWLPPRLLFEYRFAPGRAPPRR